MVIWIIDVLATNVTLFSSRVILVACNPLNCFLVVKFSYRGLHLTFASTKNNMFQIISHSNFIGESNHFIFDCLFFGKSVNFHYHVPSIANSLYDVVGKSMHGSEILRFYLPCTQSQVDFVMYLLM